MMVSVAAALRRSPVMGFFVITFLWTWTLQLPAVFAQMERGRDSAGGYMALAGLGIFGPMVGALVMTRIEGEPSGVQSLLARLRPARVPLGLIALGVILPVALLSLGLVLMNWAGRSGPVTYFPTVPALVFGLVISTAEEFGWRGYAQSRLTRRFGAIGGSCVLGILWMLWHIPMFLGQGVPLSLMLVMTPFFLGACLVMTYAYRRSSGNLFLMVLIHLGAHLNNSHRALPDDQIPLVLHSIIYAALGLLVMKGGLQSSALQTDQAM